MTDAGIYDTGSDISSIAGDESDSDQVTLSDRQSYSTSRDVHHDEPVDQSSTAGQTAKAIDAAEEASHGVNIHTRPTSTASQISLPRANNMRMADDLASVSDAGPAPPDYSAATAWRRDTESQTAHEQPAHIVSQKMKLFSFRPRFLGKRRKTKHKRWWWLLPCMIWVISTLALSIRLGTQSRRMKQWAWKEISEAPLPRLHDHIPERFHTRTSECPFDSYSFFTSFDFIDTNTFTFVDNLDTLGGAFSGKLVIGTAPDTQKVPVQVWLNAATVQPLNSFSPRAVPFGNRLELQFPQLWREANASSGADAEVFEPDQVIIKPCLDLWVGVYVRRGLKNLKIHTNNLDVIVGDWTQPGGFMQWKIFNEVRNFVEISAVRGRVMANTLGARYINIATESGSIGGEQRADISVGKEVRLTAQSGNITAFIAAEQQDEYDRATGQWVSRYKQDQNSSWKVITSTDSGNTNLEIVWPWDESVSRLQSTHTSDSGSMRINYNSGCRWAGDVDVKTANGTVELHSREGQYLEYSPVVDVQDSGRHVRAKVGTQDKARWLMETQSGNVEVHFDDLVGRAIYECSAQDLRRN